MNRFWPACTILMLAAGCAAPPHDTVPARTDPAHTNPAPSPSVPSETQPAAPTPVPSVVSTAETYLGVPYRYGGLDRNGLDCSGLVVCVYRKHDVRLPRTSAQQFRVGQPVTPDALRPGDLVFFGNGHGHVSHVGIYTGHGRFIHASTSRHAVGYDSLSHGYFHDRFLGARRVVAAAR